ncbi:MAG: hypothetical protein Q9222_003153 [Ikaeria aurantiellina]
MKSLLPPPSIKRLLSQPSKSFLCRDCIIKQHRRLLSASTTSISTRTQSLPPPPPAAGFARLTDRALISVQGRDAAHFLQGLTTSNIKASSPLGFYSSFLNAQGRVLHDVFIYPTSQSLDFREKFGGEGPEEPGFLIDVDKVHAETLRAHLRKYKLRAKIQMRVLDPGECEVRAIWGKDDYVVAGDAAPESQPSNTLICPDSRTPGMGHRALTLLDSPRNPNTNLQEEEIEETSPQTYTIHRILHGIPQGHAEILPSESLPQESNIDYMHGIDFRKGCYVGQELTIRTHHTGVVRKRILPVQLYGLDAKPPEVLVYDPLSQLRGELPGTGQNIARVNTKGRSAGKWLSGVGNIGFALCRLETMTDVRVTEEGGQWSPEHEFKMVWRADGEGEEKEVGIKAFVPSWHRGQRNVRDMHGKVDA